MLKLAVAGSTGRMGDRITTLALDIEEIKLAGALEKKGHGDLGRDIGEVIGVGQTGVKVPGTCSA